MPALIHSRLRLAALLAVALSLPAITSAQTIISARAGLLNRIDGCVLLDGTHLESGRTRLIHLSPGQRLSTESGHAEVMLGPEVFLRLGFYAEIEIESTDLSAPQARLWAGSVLIDANGLTDQQPVSIWVRDIEVRLVRKGLYRFDIPPQGPPVFTAWNGRAVVISSSRKKTVAKKQQLELESDSDRLVAHDVEPAKADALDQWSSERASEIARVNGEMLRKLVDEDRDNKRFPHRTVPWWH